ncbi:MAG: helix-turn-helix transcriptional regulator [Bacteroidaceae bacterium]|nr:helix-turn-helix transcriptional regulator [Bacteroidaceae bacterium]
MSRATPAHYILHARIEHARQLLLAHPEHTIAEVAEQCGFADQPHFTRVFRRVCGVTPGQFARKEEGGAPR